MRMRVSSRRMLMGEFAMFVSRGCVVLRLCVLTDRMMMLGLMVVMCGGVVMSSRLMMMLTRSVFR